MKKMKAQRRWVDGEIRRLTKVFNRVIRGGSFLADRSDLRLCLFLPKLVAVRYLGLRLGNLVECRVGKNILFGPGNSVTLRFDGDGIRSAGAVRVSFPGGQHPEVGELLLALGVLRKYKFRVLDVIRSREPGLYRGAMGDHFFARAAFRGRPCVIEPYGAEGEPAVTGQAALRTFHESFIQDAARFMFVGEDAVDPFALTAASIRRICFAWMREELGMSWAEISAYGGVRPPRSRTRTVLLGGETTEPLGDRRTTVTRVKKLAPRTGA